MPPTDDSLLHHQRIALAVVDEAAGNAHTRPMPLSYADWIMFAGYMLNDEEGRLVFGNAAQYLKQRAYTDARRKWINR